MFCFHLVIFITILNTRTLSVRMFFVYIGKFVFTYQIRFDKKTVIKKDKYSFMQAVL